MSDLDGMAVRTDPNLINLWGIVPYSDGPFWISENGTGVSTLYEADGQPAVAAGSALVVTIPVPSGSGPAAATSIVFNGTAGFTLQPNQPAFSFSPPRMGRSPAGTRTST